jgi:hypothetical protein
MRASNQKHGVFDVVQISTLLAGRRELLQPQPRRVVLCEKRSAVLSLTLQLQPVLRCSPAAVAAASTSRPGSLSPPMVSTYTPNAQHSTTMFGWYDAASQKQQQQQLL